VTVLTQGGTPWNPRHARPAQRTRGTGYGVLAQGTDRPGPERDGADGRGLRVGEIPWSALPANGVHIDIRRVTLDGYSPGQREHFASELQARIAAHGAPDAAARQAAEAILAAVDAQMGGAR
jgi:hypothetical protein